MVLLDFLDKISYQMFGVPLDYLDDDQYLSVLYEAKRRICEGFCPSCDLFEVCPTAGEG